MRSWCGSASAPISAAPFSDRDREALATFERLAADPEFSVSFQLERGEAAFFNNCAVLHNCTAFKDHDEPHLKRHLMRLWLMDWDGRPTVEGVRYHKGAGGIVPQGGRSRTMRTAIRPLMQGAATSAASSRLVSRNGLTPIACHERSQRLAGLVNVSEDRDWTERPSCMVYALALV